MSSLHSEKWLQNRQFGIIIDAGSSGSRIHIYSWINAQHLKDTAPAREYVGVLPTIEPGVESGSPNSSKWTERIVPGIAEFKEKPEDVGEHLEPLLDHALKVVPESEIPHTPIYLLATAGLRLVQDDIRQQILDNSCKYIKENYKFKIDICKNHIKNISGEEEGIYGWVAINYLMGGFDNGGVKMIEPDVFASEQHNKDDWDLSEDSHNSGTDPSNGIESHRHTLGFLDMGGASTQIAFEPAPQASQDHADDLTNVTIYTLDGQKLEYHVFVTTFLGYGSNQARRRYVKDYLLEGKKHLLETPQPDVQFRIQDPCLPKNLQLNETHTLPHVPLLGSGSFTECLKRVEVLLNKDKECTDVPCLFNGVHTPPIDFNINTFIGVSEYWYSSHDLLGLGGAYDYAQFEEKSAEFCNSEWDDIKARPDYQNQTLDRLETQCFKSAWLSNVLHGGFGLPRYGEKGAVGSKEQSDEVLEKAEESIRNKNWRPPFQSINAINDIQVTWALGAMLLISSGSLGPPDHSGIHIHPTHRPSQQIVPPADHMAPHEDTYAERMLESYNHYTLLAILVFLLAVFWVYRSRSSKSWYSFKRLILPISSTSPGGGNGGGSSGGFPLFGRFRRNNGVGTDYSALESGNTGGSAGSYGRGFSPRVALGVAYISVSHRTRTVLRSLVSRIWREPTAFSAQGESQSTMEGITIGGYDPNMASTVPMSGISTGGNNSPGAGGILASIPESGHPQGTFDPSFHRSHSSPNTSSRPPPKVISSFMRTKKRQSGDSFSLLGSKDNRSQRGSDGCVVNTALPQKQGQNDIELTSRSGSTTNLASMWGGNNLSSASINSNSATNTLNYQNNSGNTLQVPGEQPGAPTAWKQGWIPDDEYDDTPVPSLLSTSRSYSSFNNNSSNNNLLTPMARYKQQQLVHQDGSTSAPSSTVNLASVMGGNGFHGHGGTASGFVTSADERDEWSADNDDGDDDGDDEGDGYHHSLQHQYFQQPSSFPKNGNPAVHQYSQNPVRSASAIPFSSAKPAQNPKLAQSKSSQAVPRSQGSTYNYKQRSTGLLSGVNFESGISSMTTLDDTESANEGGYLSGGSSSAGGSRTARPGSIQTTGLLMNSALAGSRSVSPMMFNQSSASTSSLVQGRHNVSEQDQQLVSRGSSENVRRSSMGAVLSP